MISRIRDQKNYKTPNAQICFELKNSGNRSMFCLSMSSLIAAQTNIYQKKKIYLFYVVMGSRNTLSYSKIYAIVEYSQQKFKMLRRSIVQQLKNFILKNCVNSQSPSGLQSQGSPAAFHTFDNFCTQCTGIAKF